MGHAKSMAEHPDGDPSEASDGAAKHERFGAGLNEAEVRRLQVILRGQCGVDVGLPEAWSRAIALLTLVEMLLASDGDHMRDGGTSMRVRASSLLTDSPS